jgi:hypothetical protein
MVYNLPSESVGNQQLSGLLIYLAEELPFLIPALLFIVFISISLSGYYAEDKLKGRSNLFKWFMVASIITTGSTMILGLIPNLVNTFDMGFMIAITLVTTILYFTVSDDS